MSESKCIVHGFARILATTEEIKAVFIDAKARRIAFASAANVETDEAQRELEQLAGEFKPEDIPTCTTAPWQSNCAQCVKNANRPLPDGIRVVALPGSGLLLEREPISASARSWNWKQFPWMRVEVMRKIPAEHSHREGEDHHHHGWKLPLALAISSGALTLAGFIAERLMSAPHDPLPLGEHLPISIRILYTLAFICGGWFPVQETWHLLRRRTLDIHFLMILVAVGAATIGHFWEGALLLFLFSISDAFEELAQHRTEYAISSLFKEAPTTATLLKEDGSEELIAVEELRPGHVLAVRPGEMFPVDALVLRGSSAADESNLTGESIPVDKAPGERVLSGTLNLWGKLDVRVLKPAAESSLRKVIRLIQEARESKAPSQRFTDRFGSGYTYFVLVLCTTMFFIWWKIPYFHVESASAAFYRAMTLLVVSSPCALVISIPSAILAGIAAGARRGVLFRGGVALENLAQITRVGLDKTGTLTTGNLRIIAIEPQPGVAPSDLLAGAAAIATQSNHPVSQAIVRKATEDELRLPDVTGFRSETGAGLTGTIHGAIASLGRRSMLGEADWLASLPEPELGTTEVLFQNGNIRGRFVLQDEVRTASRPFLAHLRDQGLPITMLTGDRPEAAKAIAHTLGVTEIAAGLSPEDKVRQVQAWNKAGERPAMVGDGVNDAPSLAAAYVGVAMGMRGADAALEEADIILTKDRLDRFSVAYEISRQARRIIRQNLAISLGSVVILVAAAFGGLIPLTIGVIGHEGSTVIVVLNSLRLLVARFDEDAAQS
ncbi:MAG: cadmium-translocating P-type ATPase [Kiritimatiellae bacterium]|nr:cadmium-translocating P-type ATPase [Kiritimatiellia bacterium]